MSTSLFSNKNDRNILVVFAIIVFVLVSDTMINQVSDFLAPQLVTNFGIALYVFFTIASGIAQYFILRYVKGKISYMYSKSRSTRFLYKVVNLVQYILIAIIFTLVTQILISSSYSTYLLIAVTTLSYALNIALMAYFAKKFFSWYIPNRYSVIVLLYGLSFAIIAFTSTDRLILDFFNLTLRPTEIFPTTEVIFPSYDKGITNLLHSAYDYSDLFAFIILWGATVLLLHEYVQKWRIRHWILVCIPLIYYFSTFVDTFGLYTPSSDSEWFSYYLYSSLNSTAGGLLFGFAFLMVDRNIHNEMIRGHMMISAYGFILMFISNQVTLVASSYPPFGAETLCYLGLSTFMILVGLYASAISVSQDSAIRKSIRKSVLGRSKLLGSIGNAEMHMEIEKWVRSLSTMAYKSNVSTSMTSEDVKLYIKKVINEINKKGG